MAALAFMPKRVIPVNRSDFRQDQSRYLSEASDQTVVMVVGRREEEEKYIVDKRYFEELQEKLKSLSETLQITMDSKLFSQILRASATVDEDIRLGKLHSLEEAFREE